MREFAEHFAVEAPQELDGFEVLAAAVLVGDPAALGPAVVEVEHRGDGIDAQAIDAIAVEPEQRIGDEEVDDLGAPVVVDQGAPVLVPALQRIGVLVQRSAVEDAQARADRPENAPAPNPARRRAPRDGRRR